MYYHQFSDGGLNNVMSGGIGFLAAGPILTVRNRFRGLRHVSAPSSVFRCPSSTPGSLRRRRRTASSLAQQESGPRTFNLLEHLLEYTCLPLASRLNISEAISFTMADSDVNAPTGAQQASAPDFGAFMLEMRDHQAAMAAQIAHIASAQQHAEETMTQSLANLQVVPQQQQQGAPVVQLQRPVAATPAAQQQGAGRMAGLASALGAPRRYLFGGEPDEQASAGRAR